MTLRMLPKNLWRSVVGRDAEAGRRLAASVLQRTAAGRPAGRRQRVRRVIHLSPAYFDPESYVGGGERYPTSLAQAMAELVDTRLMTFGAKRATLFAGPLTIEIYPTRDLIGGDKCDPHAFGFLPGLRWADVIHCYQPNTFVSTLATYAASLLRRPCFVSDLGGGGWNQTQTYPTRDLVNQFLPISEFAIRDFERAKAHVIYGGVDSAFLAEPPAVWPRQPGVLFVGRLLPHKGIDDLVRGTPDDIPLTVMGRPYHPDYFAHLKRLAADKPVRFVTDAADRDILAAYRSATVTVLPSVYRDCYDQKHDRPELLGLVLLESQACGTPVICTAVGGMPEYVSHGRTGYVVPPNDPAALREVILALHQSPDLAAEMGAAGRQEVDAKYTWRRVAERCLSAYASPSTAAA